MMAKLAILLQLTLSSGSESTLQDSLEDVVPEYRLPGDDKFIPHDYMCDETVHFLPDDAFEALCRGKREPGDAIVYEPGTDLWCDELQPVKEEVDQYACLCDPNVVCDRYSVLNDIERQNSVPCNSTDPCDECFETMPDDEFDKQCGENRRKLFDDDTNWRALGHIIAVKAEHWAIFHHHTTAGLGGSTKYGIEFLRSTNVCEKTKSNRPYIRRAANSVLDASMYYAIPVDSTNNHKRVIHVHSVRKGEFRIKGTWKANEVGGATCTYVHAWPYTRIFGPGTLAGCGIYLWSLPGEPQTNWRNYYPHDMEYWSNTGSIAQPCQDRDCEHRFAACPSVGCRTGVTPACGTNGTEKSNPSD